MALSKWDDISQLLVYIVKFELFENLFIEQSVTPMM